ncbi:O-methyltransferase [Diaporthe helianthi]|uniref:O-methyltransferase n=1 Tax=Diaporthe helianthi TaxID=158607 RepID=A0A2P5HTI4_DIAHE|nr:O-methyltransferase [Diaporthe helianthi]
MANTDHKGSIKLTGAQETLLLTLQARAADAETAHPILNDTYAASVVKQVRGSGYDFKKRLRLGFRERPFSAFISLRSRIIDLKTESFLAAHPGRATVLHLACGLDSRSSRVRWQAEGRVWVDVDKQDVIELRRQVMSDPVAGPGAVYRSIDPSITEEGWLENCEIPTDSPVLVIMEGLTMYLAPEEVYGLFRQITRYFLDRNVHGEIYFDAAGTMLVKVVNRLGAMKKLGTSLKWALSDLKELEKEVPGLKFQDGAGLSKIIKHDAFKAGLVGTMVRNVIYGLTLFWPSTWAPGIFSYKF